jgi:malonyl-CoA O-methyltransferase
VVGDAESLPLAAGSVDLVFSSLAIQWCYRPDLLFAELARVLAPGGCCVFTSLGPGTLGELRAAWAAVDKHQHVNTFLPPQALRAAAGRHSGVTLRLAAEQFTTRYARVGDLLRELKTLGAHNINRQRPAGLTGRRALQGMIAAYEGWRTGGALPATYDVLFGVLEKS